MNPVAHESPDPPGVHAAPPATGCEQTPAVHVRLAWQSLAPRHVAPRAPRCAHWPLGAQKRSGAHSREEEQGERNEPYATHVPWLPVNAQYDPRLQTPAPLLSHGCPTGILVAQTPHEG
jgi:hypothetical protein